MERFVVNRAGVLAGKPVVALSEQIVAHFAPGLSGVSQDLISGVTHEGLVSTDKTRLPSIFFIESFLGRQNFLYRPYPIPSFRSRDSGPLLGRRSVQSPIKF